MRAFTCVTILLLSLSASATFNKSQFAGGFMVGHLTSINGKYWFSKESAMDFGIGFAGYPGTALYADYLYHIPHIFGKAAKFPRETEGYFGGGGGVAFWDDEYECGRFSCDRRPRRSGSGVFLRAMFGFEWFPEPTRFGVFAEAGPTILLSPSSGAGLDVGVGGRYYF